MTRSVLIASAVAAALLLSACKTKEEKAEDYYLSGMSYLEAGDETRALVEFRNVFKLNGFHKEARMAYADTLLRQGNMAEAYGQYLRLIEQYPDTLEVRRTMAELAVDSSNWPEAERHGHAAMSLAPDDPSLAPVRLALEYRAAIMARNETDRNRIAAEAEALLVTLPENLALRRIVIDRMITGDTPAKALPLIEQGLKGQPRRLDLHMMRYGILAQSGDVEATGAQLREMSVLFPDNIDVRNALIGWYMQQKDNAGAVAYLRTLAGDLTGPPEGHITLVQFLQSAQGPDAARAELKSLITANAGTANGDIYTALEATIDFEGGRRKEALAAVSDVVAKAAPTDQTRRIQVILARMYLADGQNDAAAEQIGTILSQDPGNVDALKIRASRAIDEDRTGDAIIDLRTALDQAPRDASVLTLMASAHERDGNLELAGERLASAVEASGAAAAESLRYAAFLLNQGRTQAAGTVLTDARRVNPQDMNVLGALAEYYLGQSLWDRAQEVVGAMAAMPLDEVRTTQVRRLRAAVLAGQNRIDESLELLQSEMSADNPAAATLGIVQTQLRAGRIDEARAYLDGQLKTTPQDPMLRLLSGSLDMIQDKPDQAEAVWRGLMTEFPKSEQPVRLLYGLMRSQGKTAEASAILETALQSQPESATLLWMRAGELERAGETEEAIAIYEKMYAVNNSDVIIINNLASLIANHHSDEQSLIRAERIARRLRGNPNPAFQDTYGWISLLRGNFSEARTHLEPAALGLPQDALTQYHLAVLYDRTGRAADAIRQYKVALEIGGEDETLPQMALAREAITRLEATLP